MSHVTTIDAEVMDLNALKLAAEEMGGTFIEGKTTFEWYGRFVGDWPLPKGMKVEDLGKCDHVIKFPGIHYELGVIKQKDGTGFKLLHDFFGDDTSGYGHDGMIMKAKVGDNCGKLMQLYAVHKATIEAKKKGYIVKRQKLDNGKIRLTIGGIK